MDAYLRESSHDARLWSEETVLSSIFFGGGTPSLIDRLAFERLMTALRAQWRFAESIEITLECNPGDVTEEQLCFYREQGVNRLSLGVQALEANRLRGLGRRHTVEKSHEALSIAVKTFDNVSADLIYATPGQEIDVWLQELEQLLAYPLSHLSLYQLSIDPGTVFYRRQQQGRLVPMDDDRALEFYQSTHLWLAQNGFSRYEVSNVARSGQHSVHNMHIWRFGDYFGWGPGAHGRLTKGKGQRYATTTLESPRVWSRHWMVPGAVGMAPTLLSAEAQAEEYMLLGLRLSEGICLERYAELAERPVPWDRIEVLRELGLLTVSSGRILCATDRGITVLNRVLYELLV